TSSGLCFFVPIASVLRRLKAILQRGPLRWGLTSRGLLVEASSRAARVVLERDGNGRIVAETTNGRRVESRLDGLGRRIKAGQPGASLVRIGRDPLGALASLTIDDHAPLAFSRDPLGRETRRASSKG
ncbi:MULTISPECIES: hypothetical protein, partial [Methylobacterium]